MLSFVLLIAMRSLLLTFLRFLKPQACRFTPSLNGHFAVLNEKMLPFRTFQRLFRIWRNVLQKKGYTKYVMVATGQH